MERHILRAEVVIIDFFDPSNPTPDLEPLPGLVTLPHFSLVHLINVPLVLEALTLYRFIQWPSRLGLVQLEAF